MNYNEYVDNYDDYDRRYGQPRKSQQLPYSYTKRRF